MFAFDLCLASGSLSFYG